MMPAKAHQIKIQIPVFLLRAFDQHKTLLLLSEVFKDPLPGIVRVVCKYKKRGILLPFFDILYGSFIIPLRADPSVGFFILKIISPSDMDGNSHGCFDLLFIAADPFKKLRGDPFPYPF